MRRVLVTGASGFIGSAVLEELERAGKYQPIALIRNPVRNSINIESIYAENLLSLTAIDLQSFDAIIHCGARVHIMQDKAADPLAEFRKANVEATLHLAQKASRAGVRRFIFLSSIKVNGDGPTDESPYRADDMPNPADPYGLSKMEAEAGLKAIAEATDLEVVVIRPVLVYGPGVKANFHSMMLWLNRCIPLPLGSVHNKRSLVALDNLVDLIATCIDHPAAANQTFLVSDDEDLSTSCLLRRLAKALNKPAWLVPVPEAFLEFSARALGKRAVAQRLCGSLQVDISKTKDLLQWSPIISVDKALKKTAERFLEKHS
ncbi:UDP-glucose 4-epimerase family protein [Pseudomonas sp. JZ134]|uniref:UDP-glucose 4-epimerase family protein n=1 Tax=Pseudomonas sp. JZ134 TaxID=2806615 RepID=UPI003DA11C6D